MKRLSVALAALCLVLIALPVAAGAAGGASKSLTFHLVEKQVAFNFVDNPPRQGPDQPPLVGDQFAFTSNLLTKSGAHAGSVSATCTVTRGGIHASGPCSGIFGFKGGQLMVMARFAFSNAPNEIVILGGTGVYRGATGYITSVSRGENSPLSDDTVHIQLP
jgi:Dirigent-like protein